MKKRNPTKETIEKLRFSHIGQKAWNKGMTKQQMDDYHNKIKNIKVSLICKYCNNSYTVITRREKFSKYCSYSCKQIGQAIGNKSRKGQKFSPKEKERRRLTNSFIHKNPMKNPETRNKVSLKALERFKDDSWRRNMHISQRKDGVRFSLESEKHLNLKLNVQKALEKNNFITKLEYPIKINKKWYIVDVFGIKNFKTVVIECGWCEQKKIEDLKSKIDIVIHIPYGKEINLEEKWLKEML